MAKQLNNIPTNITEYPNSFKRQGAFPLEAYELFYSKALAEDYAKNNPIAYVGQTIKVVDGSSVKEYIIKDEAGTLYSETQTEEENRKAYDQRITGLNTYAVPKDYENSNEKLRKMIDAIPSGGGNVDEEDVERIVDKYIDKEYLESAVKDYVDENTGAIVYLSTREQIAENIELQDVYPIQHSDSKLNIVSKNRVAYITSIAGQSGVSISTSNGYVTVSGKATSQITGSYIEVGGATLIPTGKYTISIEDGKGERINGVGTDNPNATKKCYITYELYDKKGNLVQSSKILPTTPVIIDSGEINCERISFKLYLQTQSGGTFESSNSQTFKIQVENGERATGYTTPNYNYGNKQIDIYGRNLVNPNEVYTNDVLTPLYSNGTRTDAFKTIPINTTINDDIQVTITDLGVHYFKGVMKSNNTVEINSDIKIKTPLLKDDKFTFIFNVISISGDMATISDPQIVYGYTDYEEYMPYEVESVISDSYGVCDISKLKYPYSFVSIHNFDGANNGLAVSLKYDPALSRDWVEKELNKCATYIVEQDFINGDSVGYYEKWSNGIVKYYVKQTVELSGEMGYTTMASLLSIPIEICKEIITHDITAANLTSNAKVDVTRGIIEDVGNYLEIYYNLYFASMTATVETSHTIVGKWK